MIFNSPYNMSSAGSPVLTCSIARELTLDAAHSARSSRGTTKSMPAGQIIKLLDSRNEREVLEGLRKVISVCLPAPAAR